MRFCMVTTFYPPYHYGGDATFVRGLSCALVERGHEVEVVHCEDAYRAVGGSPRVPSGAEDGVIVHRLRTPFGRLSPLITQQTGSPGPKAGRLRAVLGRDFDVVNFHNISLVGGPEVLTMSAARVTLYTLHEHWLICPTHVLWKNRVRSCDKPECIRCCLRSGIPPQLWRYTRLLERSLAKADLLLSPSHYTADRHRDAGVTRPIRVLPSFSSLEPALLERATSAGRARFLYVGRITASKGITELLEEIAPLSDIDLLVVGDGELRSALERRYAGLAHIRFVGSRPQVELAPLYRAAAAVVVPSLAPEVFPLSVIEAFACGTPVIVRDSGGSREAVDRTGGGIVYRSRAELRAALLAFAANAELQGRLGERARSGYARHYSRERYLCDYLDLVAELEHAKRGGQPEPGRHSHAG